MKILPDLFSIKLLGPLLNLIFNYNERFILYNILNNKDALLGF